MNALVGSFAKQGIEFAAQAEDVAIQFEVLMGSAEKAQETLNTLKQFTKETPFNFDQVSQAGRQLLAMDFQAEELTDVLRMIAEAKTVNLMSSSKTSIPNKGNTPTQTVKPKKEVIKSTVKKGVL